MADDKEMLDKLERVAVAVEKSNELHTTVKEHDRALRGHNNTPGLVAMVKSLAETLKKQERWTELMDEELAKSQESGE